MLEKEGTKKYVNNRSFLFISQAQCAFCLK